jgi:hypothetical protein
VKEIALNNGKVAIVDDADYEWLKQRTWHARKGRDSKTFYAGTNTSRKEPPRKLLLMHRVIVGAEPGQQVDHIDGNGLNNCRNNLRFCTNTENQYNKPMPVNNTSGYKGVSMHKHSKKWRATIGHSGKHKHIGYFDSPEEAARAYDDAALRQFGEFARLNEEGQW